jgi:hypothetical protein
VIVCYVGLRMAWMLKLLCLMKSKKLVCLWVGVRRYIVWCAMIDVRDMVAICSSSWEKVNSLISLYLAYFNANCVYFLAISSSGGS